MRLISLLFQLPRLIAERFQYPCVPPDVPFQVVGRKARKAARLRGQGRRRHALQRVERFRRRVFRQQRVSGRRFQGGGYFFLPPDERMDRVAHRIYLRVVPVRHRVILRHLLHEFPSQSIFRLKESVQRPPEEGADGGDGVPKIIRVYQVHKTQKSVAGSARIGIDVQKASAPSIATPEDVLNSLNDLAGVIQIKEDRRILSAFRCYALYSHALSRQVLRFIIAWFDLVCFVQQLLQLKAVLHAIQQPQRRARQNGRVPVDILQGVDAEQVQVCPQLRCRDETGSLFGHVVPVHYGAESVPNGCFSAFSVGPDYERRVAPETLQGTLRCFSRVGKKGINGLLRVFRGIPRVMLQFCRHGRGGHTVSFRHAFRPPLSWLRLQKRPPLQAVLCVFIQTPDAVPRSAPHHPPGRRLLFPADRSPGRSDRRFQTRKSA